MEGEQSESTVRSGRRLVVLNVNRTPETFEGRHLAWEKLLFGCFGSIKGHTLP